jgi:hypothetical protein
VNRALRGENPVLYRLHDHTLEKAALLISRNLIPQTKMTDNLSLN